MAEATIQVIAAWMTAASDDDQARGLLAYVRVELRCGLVCDGLSLRRRARGGQYLAYPSRTSAGGERHAILRPASEAVRRVLEREVFRALGMGEDDR